MNGSAVEFSRDSVIHNSQTPACSMAERVVIADSVMLDVLYVVRCTMLVANNRLVSLTCAV